MFHCNQELYKTSIIHKVLFESKIKSILGGLRVHSIKKSLNVDGDFERFLN